MACDTWQNEVPGQTRTITQNSSTEVGLKYNVHFTVYSYNLPLQLKQTSPYHQPLFPLFPKAAQLVVYYHCLLHFK